MHPLKKWLCKKKTWMVRDGNNISFFDGGVANVPSNDILELLEVYSQCCLVLPTYMIEKPQKSMASRKGLGFRYVMDIDFKLPLSAKLPSREYLCDNIVPQIQECVKKVFEKHDATLYVCVCDDKVCDNYHKTGLHLVWKDLYVCDAVALLCRVYICRHLDKLCGPPPGLMSWLEIIDEKIYDGSGMRALYAHKANPSKKCRGLGHHVCTICDGYGHVLEGRPYKIHCTIDGVTPQNVYDQVVSTTLLLPQQHTVYQRAMIENLTVSHIAGVIKMHKRKTSNPTTVRGCIEDDQITAQIRFFLSNLKPYTGVLHISKISTPSPGTYVIYTHNRLCCIQEREHTSNHVFFLVDSTACYQRCFSKECAGKQVKYKIPDMLHCGLRTIEESNILELIPGL